MTEWRWPNFSPSEVACRHCGEEGTKDSAKDTLQALRNAYGAPLVINSAYRCEEHNAAVGGVPNSRHVRGDAFDISTRGMDDCEKDKLYDTAKRVGFTGFGFYDTFLHVDKGAPRTWGNKW